MYAAEYTMYAAQYAMYAAQYAMYAAHYAMYSLLTRKRVVHVEAVEFDFLQVQGSVHEYPGCGVLGGH